MEGLLPGEILRAIPLRLDCLLWSCLQWPKSAPVRHPALPIPEAWRLVWKAVRDLGRKARLSWIRQVGSFLGGIGHCCFLCSAYLGWCSASCAELFAVFAAQPETLSCDEQKGWWLKIWENFVGTSPECYIAQVNIQKNQDASNWALIINGGFLIWIFIFLSILLNKYLVSNTA